MRRMLCLVACGLAFVAFVAPALANSERCDEGLSTVQAPVKPVKTAAQTPRPVSTPRR